VRKSVLLPMIAIFAFAGSYVYRSDPFDLVVLVAFGAFGYICRKFHFDVSPMVMAFILGPILEYSFGQTLNLAGGNMTNYLFTERPAAGILFSLVPVVSGYFWYRTMKQRRKMSV